VQGLEYSEERLLTQCDAIKFLTYKLSVTNDDLTDPPLVGDLRSQTHFYEMREGVQHFTTEHLKMKLGVMGLLRPCKTYNLNVTAEIEGNFFRNHYR